MDAPVDEAQPVARPARGRRTVPILVALLVFAVSAAGAFAALWLTKDDGFTEAEVGRYLDARAPAVTARANEVVDLLLNYDATTIDEVGDRLLELSTGNFSDDYEDLVGGGNLERALRQASASSRGQILDGPDVYFRDPSEAAAIVTVSQTAQSKGNPAGITTEYVFRIIMIRAGGEWKAHDVKILSTRST